MRLDQTNVSILESVQWNAAQTLTQLGTEVGKSPSAVQRRLVKLREIGATGPTVTLIGRSLQASRLRAFVIVSGLEPSVVAKLVDEIASEHAVQACFEFGHGRQLLLILNCGSVREAENISTRLFPGSLRGKITLQYVVRELKWSHFVPLYDAEHKGSI